MISIVCVTVLMSFLMGVLAVALIFALRGDHHQRVVEIGPKTRLRAALLMGILLGGATAITVYLLNWLGSLSGLNTILIPLVIAFFSFLGVWSGLTVANRTLRKRACN